MKKIIITEEMSRELIKMVIKEETQLNIVKDLKRYMDEFYTKGEETAITPDGKFTNQKIIGVKAKNKEGGNDVVTNITPTDLFYRLEDRLKDKIEKGEKRNEFIKQCIIDWYNGDITDEGVLSKNLVL